MASQVDAPRILYCWFASPDGEGRPCDLVAVARGDRTEHGRIEGAGFVHGGQERMKATRLEDPDQVARLLVHVGERVLEASRHEGGVAGCEVDVASSDAAAQRAGQDDDVLVLVVVVVSFMAVIVA